MIFAVGSGRCGTKTLAQVLDIPHEAVLLPWAFSATKYEAALAKALQQGGAVGCYWLPHLERMWQQYPSTKVVCLKRDREATVQSWVRQLCGRNRFIHETIWIEPDDSRCVASKFPDYGDLPIEQAAYRYYDDYYALAKQLESNHADCFRIFETEAVLNQPREQRRMWRFVGKPKAKIRCGIRTNTIKHPDEHELTNLLRDSAFSAFMKNDASVLVSGNTDRINELTSIVAKRNGHTSGSVASIDLTIQMR